MFTSADKMKHSTSIISIYRLSKYFISNYYHRISRNNKVVLPYQGTIGGCLFTRYIASYFSSREIIRIRLINIRQYFYLKI